MVNAAAYTAVDRAESDAETAFAVNRDGAGHAAAAAAAAGLPIIHISTDYVFSGDKDVPLRRDRSDRTDGRLRRLEACREERGRCRPTPGT